MISTEWKFVVQVNKFDQVSNALRNRSNQSIILTKCTEKLVSSLNRSIVQASKFSEIANFVWNCSNKSRIVVDPAVMWSVKKGVSVWEERDGHKRWGEKRRLKRIILWRIETVGEKTCVQLFEIGEIPNAVGYCSRQTFHRAEFAKGELRMGNH